MNSERCGPVPSPWSTYCCIDRTKGFHLAVVSTSKTTVRMKRWIFQYDRYFGRSNVSQQRSYQKRRPSPNESPLFCRYNSMWDMGRVQDHRSHCVRPKEAHSGEFPRKPYFNEISLLNTCNVRLNGIVWFLYKADTKYRTHLALTHTHTHTHTLSISLSISLSFSLSLYSLPP